MFYEIISLFILPSHTAERKKKNRQMNISQSTSQTINQKKFN